MKKEIYKYNIGYYLLSKVAFLFIRIYYRKIYVRGQENVPAGEPVIFAPNHKNALMDPLLILYSFPKEQVVFMAASYLFSDKAFAKFLRFLKMLPVYRMRDGIGTLGKNQEPFKEAIETLKHEKKLCLMPEGQQVEVRKLLPLVKGMFRIGFNAQEKWGNEKGVKIIPTGIEYDDLLYSGRDVIIQFGEPIELANYYKLYVENENQAYNAVRDDLYPRIEKLMLNVNSKNHYETIYLATLLNVDNYLKEHKQKNDGWNRLSAKRTISKHYLTEEQANPENLKILDEKIQKLLSLGKTDDEISRLLKKNSITTYILMIVLLPVFIPGAVFMLLPYLSVKYKNRGIKTSGFYSSISFILGIIFSLGFFIIYFIISLFFFPFQISIFIFIILVPTCSIISFKLKNLYFDTIQSIIFQIKHKKLLKKI